MRRLAVSALSAGLVGAIPLSHLHEQSQASAVEIEAVPAEPVVVLTKEAAWHLIADCAQNFIPKIYPEPTEGLLDAAGLPYFYYGKVHLCELKDREIEAALKHSGILKEKKEDLEKILTKPTKDQRGAFFDHKDIRGTRPLARQADFMELPQSGGLWDDRHIPYCIDGNLGILASWVVSLSINSMNANTVVRLRPYACGVNGHMVRFRPGAGPQSDVGKILINAQANFLGGGLLAATYNDIDVNLTPPFFFPVVYQHEIIHTYGFEHTQQRNNAAVCLNMANYDAVTDAANCGPAAGGADLGFYDFDSIMHYPNLPIHQCGTIAQVLPQPAACHGNFGWLALNLWGLSAEDAAVIALRYPVLHNIVNFAP